MTRVLSTEPMPRQPLLQVGCICPDRKSRAIHRKLAKKCHTQPHVANCWRPSLAELGRLR